MPDWVDRAGAVVRTAGPWGVIVILAGLLVWEWFDDHAAFTRSEAVALEVRMDKRIDALTCILEEHMRMPAHYGSGTQIASIAANQGHLLDAMNRVERKADRVVELADKIRDLEIRVNALERDGG